MRPKSNRVAALEAWTRADTKFNKALQALLDAEKNCVVAGVESPLPIDPVAAFETADLTATHYECRTLEWACARSAMQLVNLKRTDAPAVVLESCKRLLQERAQRLPVYASPAPTGS